MVQRRLLPLTFGLVALATACSSSETEEPKTLDGITVVGEDPTDMPLRGASNELQDRFFAGDARFDAVFREPDGLGPLYIRNACSSCHSGASRGPGGVQKMVVLDEGGSPAPDQSALSWGHTERPYVIAGATTPIAPPEGVSVKVTKRLGPAIFGAGYIEAIDDAEIERVEAEQAERTDGIHGVINRVVYHSKANPDQGYHAFEEGQTDVIGRFGLKARVATLDDFTADAFQGDMGITSPMRPVEPANPDGLTDDGKAGVDIDLATINVIADYMRLLEIPRRAEPDPRGEALFASANCAACHVPSMKTQAEYPIALLAGVDAPIFSDLLLHDMGDALADGMTDESATGRQWRTTPLIGLRHQNGFMHDGRAQTVEQAILAHEGEGSEANDSIARFKDLSIDDKKALITFVQSL